MIDSLKVLFPYIACILILAVLMYFLEKALKKGASKCVGLLGKIIKFISPAFWMIVIFSPTIIAIFAYANYQYKSFFEVIEIFAINVLVYFVNESIKKRKKQSL